MAIALQLSFLLNASSVKCIAMVIGSLVKKSLNPLGDWKEKPVKSMNKKPLSFVKKLMKKINDYYW